MNAKETIAKMTYPTVHLNGSGKENLLGSYMEAQEAITKAVHTLEEHAPNARDYYVQGDGAFEKAREEHMKRVYRIYDVRLEIEAIIDYLMDTK
jgi:hypothetical protein